MAEVNRRPSAASGGLQWNRVFIQAEEYVTHRLAARARWLELEMTDDFLDRIQNLIDLLTREKLLSVSIQMPLNWNVDPHWEIQGDTEVTVSDGLLQFTGCVIPKNWPPSSSPRMKSDHTSVLYDSAHATFIFGAVDTLVKNHRRAKGVAACDWTLVDPSLSGFDPSKYDETGGYLMIDSATVRFRKTVNSYLIEKGGPFLSS
jgi:hypothetical protein